MYATNNMDNMDMNTPSMGVMIATAAAVFGAAVLFWKTSQSSNNNTLSMKNGDGGGQGGGGRGREEEKDLQLVKEIDEQATLGDPVITDIHAKVMMERYFDEEIKLNDDVIMDCVSPAIDNAFASLCEAFNTKIQTFNDQKGGRGGRGGEEEEEGGEEGDEEGGEDGEGQAEQDEDEGEEEEVEGEGYTNDDLVKVVEEAFGGGDLAVFAGKEVSARLSNTRRIAPIISPQRIATLSPNLPNDVTVAVAAACEFLLSEILELSGDHVRGEERELVGHDDFNVVMDGDDVLKSVCRRNEE